MKKLLIVLLVALLAVALAACGGNDDTTPPTTTPAGTTPEATDTEAPGTTTEPAVTTPEDTTPTTTAEGIDILNNVDDPDYNAILATYDANFNAFTFEDFHVDLDYHVALVIKFIEGCPAMIYEDLFITNSETDNGDYTINPSYSWVVTIDGKEIPIERITLANYRTSGWARLDLGEDFSFDDYEYDEEGIHYFDVRIDIYNSAGKVEYYAYLTDPDFNGPYAHTKPAPVEMVPDENRPDDVTAISSDLITGISGPEGGLEVWQNMFDNSVRTKFCSTADGEASAVVVRFNAEQTILGLSLVNANDNESYNGRTLTDFDIYVSQTGAEDDWTLVQSFSNKDENGNPIVDKSTISTNYLERYYALDEELSASYIKFVSNNGEMFQLSELIFYTAK